MSGRTGCAVILLLAVALPAMASLPRGAFGLLVGLAGFLGCLLYFCIFRESRRERSREDESRQPNAEAVVGDEKGPTAPPPQDQPSGLSLAQNEAGERDGWRCALCGSERNLLFQDLVSPAEDNVQRPENMRLLCEECARKQPV